MINHPNRSHVSTTARRVARKVNGKQSGGFCVFAADGTGGAWYSGNSYPTLAPGEFRFWVPDRRITAAEVQAHLDDRLAQDMDRD